MASIEEVKMARQVHRTLGKRKIDISQMDIKTNHGVVYLRGQVRRLRGFDLDLKKEMEIIRGILRSMRGIRDVHMEDLQIKG